MGCCHAHVSLRIENRLASCLIELIKVGMNFRTDRFEIRKRDVHNVVHGINAETGLHKSLKLAFD